MVQAVRAGSSQREVARLFGVSLRTVQRWVQRAEGKRLDEADWSDRPDRPFVVANRTTLDVEQQVVAIRRELKDHSDLGEYGAEAILQEMIERGLTEVPCERTINRILARNGEFDGHRRVRHAPPPAGWYLPDLAAGDVELDQFDVVSGLLLEGGTEVEVLTGISVHGGMPVCWPCEAVSAKSVVEAVVEHWSQFGRPGYAQFDNDTRFQGAHQHPDVIGRVSRLCLGLGVVPVFVPPRETGFQAAIEALNNRWQQKVWQRFHHDSLEALCVRSQRYILAARRKGAVRQERAPRRRPMPRDWQFNVQVALRGKMIYLRRTDDEGQVSILGHMFKVQDNWVHRLVRAEVDFDQCRISFYALRRREPTQQKLLQVLPYHRPHRPFR